MAAWAGYFMTPNLLHKLHVPFPPCVYIAFSLLTSTASVFLLYIVHSEVFVVIMLCLFTALSTPAWNDTSLIIAEVYPTHLR